MITAFRVKNLRGIVDSDWIELRPITIFVGRNSSGKSSLLRIFPLLRQSLSPEIKEPVLWYGRFVDFGTFSNALSKFAKIQEITFGFRLTVQGNSDRRYVVTESGDRVFFVSGKNVNFISENLPVELELSIRDARRKGDTYIHRLSVVIGSDALQLVADDEGNVTKVIFNDNEISELPKARIRAGKGAFFPTLFSSSRTRESNPRSQFLELREGPYADYLIEKLRPFVHGNTSSKSMRKIASRIAFGGSQEFIKDVTGKLERIKHEVESEGSLQGMGSVVEPLRVASLLRALPGLLRQANAQINELGENVRYLEPVRAFALRYYRFQELAIDEIDSRGENVPMFLNSLTSTDRKNLQDWMSEAFGFQVKAKRSAGHTTLIVKEESSKREFNLADTGFGYSQILPIVLQLWKTRKETTKKRIDSDRQTVIAVEQPELHLHPQFQALLGDIFSVAVESAKSVNFPLQLVIETHSDHLINRLGALVSKGKLQRDDIGIYLCDRKKATGPTNIVRAQFNEQGVLGESWPFGFFSPDLD